MAVTINGTTGITAPAVDALDLELNGVNVVERGSNANGSYTRFADGTQICASSISLPGSGIGYRDVLWTFPAAFSLFPSVSGQMTAFSGSFNYLGNGTVTPVNTTSITVTAYSTLAGNGGADAFVMAIGRWY